MRDGSFALAIGFGTRLQVWQRRQRAVRRDGVRARDYFEEEAAAVGMEPGEDGQFRLWTYAATLSPGSDNEARTLRHSVSRGRSRNRRRRCAARSVRQLQQAVSSTSCTTCGAPVSARPLRCGAALSCPTTGGRVRVGAALEVEERPCPNVCRMHPGCRAGLISRPPIRRPPVSSTGSCLLAVRDQPG